MTRKSRRLWLVVACMIGLGSAAALTLNAFSSNIVFFMAPSQVHKKPPPADRTIRLGGMVVAGSVHREKVKDTPVAIFDVTDGQDAVTVRYEGILPDLFREGQSVVAVGTVNPDGTFRASEVLAKHDETYMPKEVAEELRRSGKWDPRFGKAPDATSWNTMTATDTAKKPATQTPDGN
ncbi:MULTISPECIES: cytochrome c maturation protein CcmE [Komagataeibacter]|uniref:Cytochrome c-type biogenesis protein CcmE n=1 Tax=Komagataeibacter saccharivorans TaxID=265959 RepID=A0A347WCG5_9PROT|nr:cytochrome c maturation protein CcmE [Komagataeibacter saccharivorans]MBL7237256.1 cytochrome c maturation protein CcmE [Novacetimonas hansenii]AXY22558.1 Cytochrome c-type biogenesis protein CcmE [Komagataeibacter saccharivorans]PMP98334.1 Cytochrome c-type bioproteinis protein CcmE [Komagataeibacter saccharivorans]PYD52110.1 cytochrome c biogenesis protein CcmE [Komagataeibacter saccharivorans]QBL93548.1 Cytochrome c-type biogenesis protein CcmE [Komagataeibacter saccharivorans]